jgi:hypothetical protein
MAVLHGETGTAGSVGRRVTRRLSATIRRARQRPPTSPFFRGVAFSSAPHWTIRLFLSSVAIRAWAGHAVGLAIIAVGIAVGLRTPPGSAQFVLGGMGTCVLGVLVIIAAADAASRKAWILRKGRGVVSQLIDSGDRLHHHPGFGADVRYFPAQRDDFFDLLEAWRADVRRRLRKYPFNPVAGSWPLETGGNRLDPVIERLRHMQANIDRFVSDRPRGPLARLIRFL